MAVVLAHLTLSVTRKAHAWARDAHGVPIPTGAAETTTAAYPGAAREVTADNTWELRLDPQLWPVYDGDTVSDGSRTWVVTHARLASVPGHPDVDHVAVTARLDPPRVA